MATSGLPNTFVDPVFRREPPGESQLPVVSSGHWQADHGDSESVVKLCLRGEAIDAVMPLPLRGLRSDPSQVGSKRDVSRNPARSPSALSHQLFWLGGCPY